jgi:hypothetical protein
MYAFMYLSQRLRQPDQQRRRGGSLVPGSMYPRRIQWISGPSALSMPARAAEFRAMGNARRLTGVAGRWSAGHPWTAIAAWIGTVVVLMVTGHLAGTLQLPYGAVTAGIKTTAGVVTAAAVVMVFVFLTFATLSMIQLKEMGVGLAVAVLLDATVVRAVLLPATMKLLGPRNWYLPRWLGWLPGPSRPAPPPTGPPVPPSAAPPPVTRVGA